MFEGAALGVTCDAEAVEPALTRPQGRPSLSFASRNQVMATFTREITINAPVVRVWEALGDIGSISRWNPGVVRWRKTRAVTS